MKEPPAPAIQSSTAYEWGAQPGNRNSMANWPPRSLTGPFLPAHQPLPSRQTLSPSPDYRIVTVRGKTYKLTRRQSQMIKILYEAHENGNPDVDIQHIQKELDTPDSRWQDTWKSNKEARVALIQSGARKGTLRLNL